MHTCLAAFFTALLSFCHAASIRHASVKADAFTRKEPAYTFRHVPARRELARFQIQARGGYAEGACLSCRKMNVVYYTR